MSNHARCLLAGLTAAASLAIVAAFALPVSAARAGVIDLAACNTSSISQPFTAWGDPASYELAPGGDFETPSWTLSGRAQPVRGSEPYAATGTLGRWSLQLPAGSSAQSPSTCVDAAYPTLRFFITGGGLVAVSIVSDGLAIPAGVAVGGPTWLPTPVMITGSPITAALSNGVANVSFRLTTLVGDPRVDDVFVDPWFRG